MSDVWIVTTGEYSDYRVRAVFSTPEAAQAYADELDATKTYTHAKVDGFSCDLPREDRPGAWRVILEPNGYPRGAAEYQLDRTPGKPAEEWNMAPTRCFVGWGRTIEHARRSAEDLRREQLAVGA